MIKRLYNRKVFSGKFLNVSPFVQGTRIPSESEGDTGSNPVWATKMKESEITKEEFIRISNESKTRIEAYYTLGMHRNTYNKYCLEFNYDFNKCHGGKNTERLINMI